MPTSQCGRSRYAATQIFLLDKKVNFLSQFNPFFYGWFISFNSFLFAQSACTHTHTHTGGKGEKMLHYHKWKICWLHIFFAMSAYSIRVLSQSLAASVRATTVAIFYNQTVWNFSFYFSFYFLLQQRLGWLWICMRYKCSAVYFEQLVSRRSNKKSK